MITAYSFSALVIVYGWTVRMIAAAITELDEDRLLAEQAPFNGLILLLRHVLQPQENGGTLISRQLEISGENADDQAAAAGPRISEEYP